MMDFFYNVTVWLRGTSLAPFALKMSEWPLTNYVVTHFWVIPILQITHILAIALAFSAVLMMNGRILGLNGEGRSIAQTTNRYMPWMWWGLVFIVASGVGMLFGDTVRNLLNAIFWTKMTLVVITVLVSIWFHKGILRDIREDHDIGGTEKAVAVVLVLLWIMVMFGGRWIAYAPT